jgi:hypothetical protein
MKLHGVMSKTVTLLFTVVNLFSAYFRYWIIVLAHFRYYYILFQHTSGNTVLYFQHTFGIHTPVGNSNMLTQDFSSVRLPTRCMTCPGSWSSCAVA